ncbi:MAG: hypothetical protein PSX71_01730 [bacterium]|nr:hypothetical protein [bacterium]
MATMMKQAAFARRHGVSEKTVTMWKKRGWVVTCEGKVNVDESEANLKKYRAAGVRKNLTRADAGKEMPEGKEVTPMAQLLSLDWQHPVTDWSVSAQEARARLACQCVGEVAMVRASKPYGDGNWGGWQLRDLNVEHGPLDSLEQVWTGYGYELQPFEILRFLRKILADEQVFPDVERPDLLHTLAFPLAEWECRQELGQAAA